MIVQPNHHWRLKLIPKEPQTCQDNNDNSNNMTKNNKLIYVRVYYKIRNEMGKLKKKDDA